MSTNRPQRDARAGHVRSAPGSLARHLLEEDDKLVRRRARRRRRPRQDRTAGEYTPPNIPVPETVELEELDVSCVVTEGQAVAMNSYRGETINDPQPLAAAIRSWYEPGKPFVVALRGRITEAAFIAGGYSHQNAGAFQLPSGEYAALDVRIFGVDGDAELGRGLYLGDTQRDFGTISRLEIWNAKIRVGLDGTRAIRNFDTMGPLVLDGCAWLPHQESGNLRSGMELGHPCEFVMIRNHRRVLELGKLVQCDEHSLAYLKGQGAIYLLNNDASGGGRTATQIRPHLFPWETSAQRGPILIEGNTAVDPDLEHGDGGSMFTVWNSMNAPVVIRNNKLDCPYGGISIGWQPASAGNFTDEDGLAHKHVALEGNEIVARTRSACKVNAAQEVHFLGGNDLSGGQGHDLLLGSRTNVKWGAPPNKEVWFHDRGEALAMNPQTWVDALDEYVPLGADRIENMLWKATQ